MKHHLIVKDSLGSEVTNAVLLNVDDLPSILRVAYNESIAPIVSVSINPIEITIDDIPDVVHIAKSAFLHMLIMNMFDSDRRTLLKLAVPGINDVIADVFIQSLLGEED